MERKDIVDILYRGESKRPLKRLVSYISRLMKYIIRQIIANTLNPPENLNFVSLEDSDDAEGLKLIKAVSDKEGCKIQHNDGEIPLDENLAPALCKQCYANRSLQNKGFNVGSSYGRGEPESHFLTSAPANPSLKSVTELNCGSITI